VEIGSTFFFLAQVIPLLRAKGSSFAMVCMLLFNLLVCVGFPILVEARQETRTKGIDITFMAFGVGGALALCLLIKHLKPYEVGVPPQG
jgi:Na+/melibiose symporter-like transporter